MSDDIMDLGVDKRKVMCDTFVIPGDKNGIAAPDRNPRMYAKEQPVGCIASSQGQ